MVTLGYAGLIAGLLFVTWRVSDLESRSVGLAIIGLPWIFVLRSNRMLLYALVRILNAATVYIFVLSLVRVFAKDQN
jgi:hypothetical protein